MSRRQSRITRERLKEVEVPLTSAEIHALIDGLSISSQIAQELGNGEAWRSAREKLDKASLALRIEVPHRSGADESEHQRHRQHEPSGESGHHQPRGLLDLPV